MRPRDIKVYLCIIKINNLELKNRLSLDTLTYEMGSFCYCTTLNFGIPLIYHIEV